MKAIKFTQKAFTYLTGTILSLFSAFLIYTGCVSTTEEIPTTLEVSKHSLNFSYSGAEDNFTVTSNYKWTVSRDASWLIVSPSSGSDNGTVTVVSEQNTNTNAEPRTAIITVGNGIPDKEQTIAVTQNSPSLTVSETSLSFSNNAESKSFTITSNASWTVSNNTTSWLTVSPASGSNDGTVNVTAANNSSENKRETTISVSGGGITKTISVTQETFYLTVSPLTLIFSSSGEQKPFTITSNTSWNVSSNPSTWLTIAPVSGSNDRTVTVTASANSSTSQRTATITVSGGGITPIIDVNQAAITFNNYTETTNGLNLEMIAVLGGTFTMGCTSEQGDDCLENETPTHQVTLNNFYIGKYEVTQGQWKAVMGNNPSCYQKGDNYPVESVSWEDIVGTSGATMVIKNITYYANGFIYTLNQLTGKQYRLPTEAEWEYAARGGNESGSYKYSGSNSVGNVAWYWDNIPSQPFSNSRYGTQPVGTKASNELGIYDMSGNVGEWCSDWFGDYSSNAQTNPTGPSSGSRRVVRGGGWDSGARYVRVSVRGIIGPSSTDNLGFRLTCSSN